jgi:hypothetical protein
MPVSPPMVKRNKKPKHQRTGVSMFIGVPCKEANQEKILIPVGTAITIVAEVK